MLTLTLTLALTLILTRRSWPTSAHASCATSYDRNRPHLTKAPSIVRIMSRLSGGRSLLASYAAIAPPPLPVSLVCGMRPLVAPVRLTLDDRFVLHVRTVLCYLGVTFTALRAVWAGVQRATTMHEVKCESPV